MANQCRPLLIFFFFNDTATTEIYTLSLHDALPISAHGLAAGQSATIAGVGVSGYNGTVPVVSILSSTQFTYIAGVSGLADRKSTRLNSSHDQISYAVFCLKKKKEHCAHLLFRVLQH